MKLDIGTRIRVLERQIAIIEDDPKNTIGGSKAFFSGNKSYFTDAAIKKIARLNAKIELLYDQIPNLDSDE